MRVQFLFGHFEALCFSFSIFSSSAISARSCGRAAERFIAINVSRRTTGVFSSSPTFSHLATVYSCAKRKGSYTKTSIGVLPWKSLQSLSTVMFFPFATPPTLRTSIVSAFPRDVKIPEDKDVHFRAQKAIERLLWAANHWFVFIEGSIQDDGNGRQAGEFRDQLMVKRIRVGMDGLQPARAIHVTHSRKQGAFFRANLEDLHHE